MGIPGWFVWIFLVLFLWQVLGLFPVIQRLREDNSALRSKARLDLLEILGSLLLFGGSLLSFMVGESWFWLGLAGFLLLTAVYAVKVVHWLRARHQPTT
ncbi:hypothetical protein [Streptomyces griseorubiginosus]|uniref:hypothetical protein n=1 Tax=Streptomyces griseorubiginosus TaxID=67304 RepID=UPI002E80D321|nr:hypothetical protein [Streptomyces griseorubiginosus]WUB44336.1 hypothetical protein OHN19_13680 [Streptomyces griseorubiginosus]WUB52854.1 hypothetical protein OG942_13675 [Streptomyces griseorubiginosus]